ncbi:MAG: GTP-binding protein [Cytophagaceae bacterium]|nr:GTP-binding protein [Cytophagaceae bacterium]MBL0302751.1 GTP-binding protein [Cytophagaceae bacterium]MBL0325572.1 GTP-binding protein [Cytophagaceae bacterium]
MSKPVTILTGFLGAGKTTFLNQAISERPGIRYAIVENEFGKEGIDGELIIKPDNEIFELNNGCLCCSLNDGIYDILNELSLKTDQFDELIIETTGIADPAAVASPFFSHSEIKKDFPVKRVICLVDTELIEDQLIETDEAIKQIAFSDIILLNKTVNVNPEYLTKIEEKLLGINPFLKVFTEKDMIFPVKEIFNTERDLDIEFKMKPGRRLAFNHGKIVSHTFYFDQPFNDKELQMRLFGYLVFEAKGLYRIKGIIHGKDVNHKLILQSVGQSLSISGGKPWAADDERQSKIVFIGKELNREFFEELLNGCLA